ncbi:MAG: cytochrome c [Oligoflexales bacterium]
MKTLLISLCLIFLTSAQKPRNKEEAEVFYRRSVMSQIDAHLMILMTITSAKLESRKSDLSVQANAMMSLLKESEDLFSEERKKGKTRAKSNVWREKNKFIEMMKKNQSQVKTFVEAIPSESWKSLEKKVDDIRKSCIGCHKSYKLSGRPLEAL